MLTGDAHSLNSLSMAKILAGCWRRDPAPGTCPFELIAQAEALLLASGTAGLVWWSLHRAAKPAGEAFPRFRQAYTYYTLRAGFHEAQARRAFAFFRANGIEPVLIKGWSIGRRYPAKGLRPYGDIDLSICPSSYEKALRLAAGGAGERFNLDLHNGLTHLDDRSFEAFIERTVLIPLGDLMARVPCEEDLFRIACLHFLRHGGWRPLQLCDVALLLETRAPEFRWDVCTGASRREINWISTAIGLAHHLLGANIEGYPYASQARHIPQWLIARVLRLWETPAPTSNAPLRYGRPMRTYLRRPRGLFGALRRRWPGPIEATYALNGLFNHLPRFPYQFADSLRRAMRFLTPRSICLRTANPHHTLSEDL
jgi:hypothetical protein